MHKTGDIRCLWESGWNRLVEGAGRQVKKDWIFSHYKHFVMFGFSVMCIITFFLRRRFWFSCSILSEKVNIINKRNDNDLVIVSHHIKQIYWEFKCKMWEAWPGYWMAQLYYQRPGPFYPILLSKYADLVLRLPVLKSQAYDKRTHPQGRKDAISSFH